MGIRGYDFLLLYAAISWIWAHTDCLSTACFEWFLQWTCSFLEFPDVFQSFNFICFFQVGTRVWTEWKKCVCCHPDCISQWFLHILVGRLGCMRCSVGLSRHWWNHCYSQHFNSFSALCAIRRSFRPRVFFRGLGQIQRVQQNTGCVLRIVFYNDSVPFVLSLSLDPTAQT